MVWDPVTTKTSSTSTCKLVVHLSTGWKTWNKLDQISITRKTKLHSKKVRDLLNLFDWLLKLMFSDRFAKPFLLSQYNNAKASFSDLNRQLKRHERIGLNTDMAVNDICIHDYTRSNVTAP